MKERGSRKQLCIYIGLQLSLIYYGSMTSLSRNGQGLHPNWIGYPEMDNKDSSIRVLYKR